ncbi:amidohydrolase family protein [Herbaspirillum sp. NPDC087042]|uniref:amidohydrolase family protein n=1 Tax=Herbaspirillum sp. NPDC087042 TaxID=3364004 RepID=UPI0037F736B2
MSILQGRIDVHHHLIPPALSQTFTRLGIEKVAGAPLPAWSPRKSIDVMDGNGIQVALLSVSSPGTYFGDIAAARTLSRSCNEYVADVKSANPGRFGHFAVLPMPFTQWACEEAIFALDVLKAEGIVLMGSSDGRFLGDPSFDELMAELDRRQATVFLHPNLHASSEQLGLVAPGFFMEFLCDTTRAALNLIFTGTMERYPGIKWILAHAGGFLPYIAWRASLANMIAELSGKMPQGVLTYLRRFYFDTALSPADYSMAALKQLVDPTHILFGSDFPFAPAPVTTMQSQTLQQSSMWSDEVKYGINRGHALSLFPQFRQADETVVASPVYRRESLGHYVRRTAALPLGMLANHLRNR